MEHDNIVIYTIYC